jgi:hypothetical protein
MICQLAKRKGRKAKPLLFDILNILFILLLRCLEGVVQISHLGT